MFGDDVPTIAMAGPPCRAGMPDLGRIRCLLLSLSLAQKYSSGRATQQADTRRRIIAAALELYQEQGVSATTMLDIARRADVAPAPSPITSGPPPPSRPTSPARSSPSCACPHPTCSLASMGCASGWICWSASWQRSSIGPGLGGVRGSGKAPESPSGPTPRPATISNWTPSRGARTAVLGRGCRGGVDHRVWSVGHRLARRRAGRANRP